jgi:hypothetical protein
MLIETRAVPLEVINLQDPDFETWVCDSLNRAGFDATLCGDVVHLAGVGAGGGDSSVDLSLDLLSMNEHRVLGLSAIVGESTNFSNAALAALQGNNDTHVVKFKTRELVEQGEPKHQVVALTYLYADHLSEEELSTMTWLFVREVDRVDNELREIIRSTPRN